jgi:hypothetical protein
VGEVRRKEEGRREKEAIYSRENEGIARRSEVRG